MCLAVPSKIISINDLMATVEVYGTRTDASLFLMPEEVNVGDYVLVHAGFAIQKLNEDAALDSLALLREMAEKLEEEEGSYPDGVTYPS